MPFTVQSVTQVTIDMTAAGPDDFLLLTLEDESRLLLQKESCPNRLTFNEEFMPPSLVALSFEIADEYRENARQSKVLRKSLMHSYEQRPDRDLNIREFLARAMRDKPLVYPEGTSGMFRLMRHVNIGNKMHVSMKSTDDSPDVWGKAIWTSTAVISTIEPVTRTVAKLLFEAYPEKRDCPAVS